MQGGFPFLWHSYWFFQTVLINIIEWFKIYFFRKSELKVHKHFIVKFLKPFVMRVLKNARANLENKRRIFFQIGAIIALLFVIVAFEYRTYEKDVIPEIFNRNFDEIEEFSMVTIHKEPPPPPKVKSRPIVINVVENTEIDSSLEIDFSTEEDDPMETWTGFDLPDEPEIDSDSIFISVEQKPEFPGGLSGLYSYFKNNVKYPLPAMERGISGRVFLNFVVEPDGSISNVIVLRGIGGGCDEEAVRVIRNMPLWEPGRQRGRAVRVSFTVPIKFTLN